MFGKKKKHDDYDDGRTIANMNIDGMPGYNPIQADRSGFSPRPTIGEHGEELPLEREDERKPELLSGKDLHRVIFSATMAGVAIALVFIAGAFLFIQFCLHVWLH